MSAKINAIETWLLPLLRSRTPSAAAHAPFVLGLSGLQGSGKSTLVTQLQDSLTRHGYRTVQFSLDDLYLTFRDQVSLSSGSGNRLWESRGQFGTHDVDLAKDVMDRLKRVGRDDDDGGDGNGGVKSVEVPRYDKSRHGGRGDRADRETWQTLSDPIDVILFEGWGIGFTPLPTEDLTSRIRSISSLDPQSLVSRHSIHDLTRVNDALKGYCETFMGPHHFDAMVMLQARDTRFVYAWRTQQERAMIAVTGSGMTDREVREFVDRYYSSYEIYLPDALRGVFGSEKKGRQMNLMMNEERELVGTKVI